ncbi:hypothetical protein [Corynebacterium durum]|nr:hypothetical protein [Corynebacterium durum]
MAIKTATGASGGEIGGGHRATAFEADVSTRLASSQVRRSSRR